MADRATRYRWDDLEREQLNPSIGRRLVTGERLMLAHVYFTKGGTVPKHAHDNEQITYVLDGCLRFFLGDDGDEVVDVRAGEVLDYVVVHELCHLREHNHSRRFWSLVEQRRPHWRAQRDWLHEHGPELLAFRPAV